MNPRHLTLFKLFLLLVLRSLQRISGEETPSSITEFERIPIHHALLTLEAIGKEDNMIEAFCYKHLQIGYKNSTQSTTYEEHEPSFCDKKPTNCADLFNGGRRNSGIYDIHMISHSFAVEHRKVFCDMETDGGGWTVFQRRGPFPPQISFSRPWVDYSRGFGNLMEEFWLGNENIHALTNQDRVRLRIDLGDFNGNFTHAVYEDFRIGSEAEGYAIMFGDYSGNANDSLKYHKGSTFVTTDRNDVHQCAKTYRGGWWYKYCHDSNLNGAYNVTVDGKGVTWQYWLGDYYSLRWTEMKMRPQKYDPTLTIKLCQ